MLLLSVAPGTSSRPDPVRAPRQARQKPVPPAAAPGSQNNGHMVQGRHSLPREKVELGVSSQSHGTVLGGATHFPASSSEAVGFELLTKGTGPCMVVEVSP